MIIIDKSTYKLRDNIRKILLIQLGDIGDVVWTIPSIWAVKNSIQCSEISVMVQEGFGGLLEADSSVAQVFEVKRYNGNLFQQAASQLSFLKDIRAQHFDLVVDLRLGDRGAFMSFATGAPYRVTMHHPEGVPFWRSYLFTHGIVPDYPVHPRGATDQSLRILRKLGIDSDDIIPRLQIADSVKRHVGDILAREKMDSLTPFFTVNPFSRWSYKEWDHHKWIEILNWLWREFSIPIIVIGSTEERPKAEALIRQGKAQGVFNFAGLTTLPELSGLLSLSRLHIGVDSAAPHIAAATGTPTVTIYGPSSWEDWAPLGKDHYVIVSDMNCIPCRQMGCNSSGRSRCLEELGTDQVKKVIRKAIATAAVISGSPDKREKASTIADLAGKKI
jgi:ADP-heptose:LPS heptosyltransferase